MMAEYIEREPSEYEILNNRLCPHCRKPVVPSEISGYKWQCLECDEDFCDFECYKAEGK